MTRLRERLGMHLPRMVAAATLLAAGVLLVVPASRAFLWEVGGLLARLDFAGLKDFLRGYGHWAWLVSSFLMLLQALAAPLPAVAITLANALLYGPWWGALLSWTSAQVASVICYWLGKALGRPFVERMFSARVVDRFDGFFQEYGVMTVLVARLLPVVSFDAVSYAAGLTRVRLWPFFLATGLGQLPATLVYSYAGAELLRSGGRAVTVVLTFIGVMVLLGWLWWVRHRRRERQRTPPAPRFSRHPPPGTT